MQREAKTKKERPAKKGVGTPKKKRKALGVPRDSWVVVTAWGAPYEREKTQRLIICDDGES